MHNFHDSASGDTSRRRFIRHTSLAVAGLAAAGASDLFAAGDAAIRIGVIGCGGRGTGAMLDALRDLGYTVVHASGGGEALRTLREYAGVRLLVTDVVMPEMNGRELADAALRLSPDLKLLFTTGYSRNAIIHNGVLDPGVQLIGKPFTVEELAAKVRAVLEPVREGAAPGG